MAHTPDGLTVAAFIVLIVLLVAWAKRRAADNRVEQVERHRIGMRRLRDRIDRDAEVSYREQLRDEVSA